MSRSTSFEAVTGFAAPPRCTVLLTTLLAICAMGAVAQKDIDFTSPVLADNYPDPSLQSISYTDLAVAGNYPDPLVQGVSYTNPVLAGNYPDPPVIRVGQDYWATAISSGWAPLFPMMQSRDLVSWTVVGSVFQQRPTWSDGN
jgi:hypothetical protein